MGVASVSQNVTRAKGVYLCLSPYFVSLTIPPPSSSIISVLPFLASLCQFPLSLCPHLTLLRPTSMLNPPQAIFCIHVTTSTFALLHLLLIAPPLCPNFPVFPSIDPSLMQNFFLVQLVLLQ